MALSQKSIETLQRQLGVRLQPTPKPIAKSISKPVAKPVTEAKMIVESRPKKSSQQNGVWESNFAKDIKAKEKASKKNLPSWRSFFSNDRPAYLFDFSRDE